MIYRTFNYQEDLEKQRELYLDCFPEHAYSSEKEIDHYMWKFHSPGRKAYEYGAYLNNEIIGYYAALPYNYTFQGKLIKTAMVCDVMTGTKARGKGVFTNLGIHATEQLYEAGFDFTTGYPVRKEVIPGHLKAGWREIFHIPIYVKIVSFVSIFKKKKLHPIGYLFQVFLRFWLALLGALYGGRAGNVTVESYSQRDLNQIDGFEDYLAACNQRIPLYLSKDMNFLKWRLGAPKKEYRIFILRDNQSIAGYLISCNAELKGIPSTCILDLFLSEGKHYKLLLDGLEEFAKTSNSGLIVMMISKYRAKQFKLFRYGFIKTPLKFTFISKQLNKSCIDYEFQKNEKNWHLMWIDSDDL